MPEVGHTPQPSWLFSIIRAQRCVCYKASELSFQTLVATPYRQTQFKMRILTGFKGPAG